MGVYLSKQHRFVLKIILLVVFYLWAGTATGRYKYALIVLDNPGSYSQGVTPMADDAHRAGAFFCGATWPVYWVCKGIYHTTAWADITPINTVEAP